MSANTELLSQIKSRSERNTAYWNGISTADRYVKTLEDCVGMEACQKFACRANVSYFDALKRASKTLVYTNDDMVLKEKVDRTTVEDEHDIELPPNTLVLFRHTLTTPKKDRDGDVLRTEGAIPDPKMLLLWQHVHTLPVGKMIAVDVHNSKQLVLISAVVDMNKLSHDAAVMIENKMGRFSHGFRAIKFDKIKESRANPTGGGFDVKEFEIMEESIVSVPANTDAEVDDIMLSLVEGGKLTSPIMKSYGSKIREVRPKSVGYSPKIRYIEKDGDTTKEIEVETAEDFEDVYSVTKDQDDGKGTGSKHDCGCGQKPCSCSSEETNVDDEGKEFDGGDTKHSEDAEVKMAQIEGSWEYIEHGLRKAIPKHFGLKTSGPGEYGWLVATFADHAIVSIHKDGEDKYYRLGWKMDGDDPVFFGDPEEVKIETTTSVMRRDPKVIHEELVEKVRSEHESDVKQSMASFLAHADDDELNKMTETIDALKSISDSNEKATSYRQLIGSAT